MTYVENLEGKRAMPILGLLLFIAVFYAAFGSGPASVVLFLCVAGVGGFKIGAWVRNRKGQDN